MLASMKTTLILLLTAILWVTFPRNCSVLDALCGKAAEASEELRPTMVRATLEFSTKSHFAEGSYVDLIVPAPSEGGFAELIMENVKVLDMHRDLEIARDHDGHALPGFSVSVALSAHNARRVITAQQSGRQVTLCLRPQRVADGGVRIEDLLKILTK